MKRTLRWVYRDDECLWPDRDRGEPASNDWRAHCAARSSERWHRRRMAAFGPRSSSTSPSGKIPRRRSRADSANSARVHRQLPRRSEKSAGLRMQGRFDAPTCPELPQVARSRVSVRLCPHGPTSVRQPGSKNAPQEFVARSRVGKDLADLRFKFCSFVALPAAADISAAVCVDHVSGGGSRSRDRPKIGSSEQPIPPLRRTPAGRLQSRQPV